ncbi:MAG: putative glycosyltransferase [Parcubacteria group bacterium GW2011_GWA1_36_12]|nr:MAG: putative glycosyltransferase [Parcubacteria group bacterium GW2011_GWA1_36_12]
MKALIVVPAFNEVAVIHSVLKSLPKKLPGISELRIVVVNDGSTDSTQEEAQRAGVEVLTHSINRGLGAAIKTGLEVAKRGTYDLMVTFDGDGQHDPADVAKIVDPIIKKKADLVIGARFKRLQNIPIDRLILNWFANLATLMIFGVTSTDSQSGLRAFSKKAIELIDFKGERMDFSSEILLEAKKHNLVVVEVPIKAIYTPYSRAKGQKNLNSLAVFLRFLVRIFR